MNTTTHNCHCSTRFLIALSFMSLCPIMAQADTPAQTQQAVQAVCNRAAASYEKRDLSGFIAMYSPSFIGRNVSGKKVNFRQDQAGIANIFAKDNLQASAVCTVSQIVSQGSQARAVLHWHFVTRTVRVPIPYTLTRDYQERSLWKKTTKGWQEVSNEMTYDTLDYRR